MTRKRRRGGRCQPLNRRKMGRGWRPFPDRLSASFGQLYATPTPPPCQHFSPSFYGTCLLRSSPSTPRQPTFLFAVDSPVAFQSKSWRSDQLIHQANYAALICLQSISLRRTTSFRSRGGINFDQRTKLGSPVPSKFQAQHIYSTKTNAHLLTKRKE